MNDFEQGNIHYMAKEYHEACECYKRFLKQEPNNYIVWHNLGISLSQIGEDVEALQCFELPCSHNYVESWLSRGTALRSLGRYREALITFAHTFALDPKHSTAYSNYGNTLREFGLPELAIPFLKIAQELTPGNVNYELNESVSHLMKGDLIEGWKKYEARWYYQSDISLKPQLPGPEYDGSQDIVGKKVLVYYEQGFGDSIQFIRFAKVLKDKGAEVIIITKPQLYDLFKYNLPDLNVLNADAQIPPYHYHVALMALPKCFGTTIDTIPYPTPYLDVDEGMKQSWKQLLGPKTKKRIGLLWSPNKIAFISRFRRIELEQLLSITSDEYEFVSLSYEVDENILETLAKYNVKTFHENLTGFYNTAGLISQMDLVISIDTVIPHLSGAMGVPTWVMLTDYGCDWRWFMNRNDSPFYNCMKLFRQNDGSWDSVLKRIKIELDNK
jgi:tetratricopeptide (TPR) repeat protein